MSSDSIFGLVGTGTMLIIALFLVGFVLYGYTRWHARHRGTRPFSESGQDHAEPEADLPARHIREPHTREDPDARPPAPPPPA